LTYLCVGNAEGYLQKGTAPGLRILILLAHLTPEQREVLVDTVIIGETYREVAARMGCSIEGVRLLQAKALDLLEPALDRSA